MYFPSFPDAPTTQILMTRLDSSQFHAIEPARPTFAESPKRINLGQSGAVHTDADAPQVASQGGGPALSLWTTDESQVRLIGGGLRGTVRLGVGDDESKGRLRALWSAARLGPLRAH